MVIQRTEFVSLPLGHVGRLTKNNLAYLHPSVSTFQRSLSYWAGELQLRPSLHLQMRAWCSKVLWKAENQYSTKVLGLFEIISVKGFVQYIQFLFFDGSRENQTVRLHCNGNVLPSKWWFSVSLEYYSGRYDNCLLIDWAHAHENRSVHTDTKDFESWNDAKIKTIFSVTSSYRLRCLPSFLDLLKMIWLILWEIHYLGDRFREVPGQQLKLGPGSTTHHLPSCWGHV